MNNNLLQNYYSKDWSFPYCRYCFFPHFAEISSCRCYHLVSCFIWHARNSATFRNSYLPPRAIVNTIIKDIQLRIRGEPIDHVRYFWSVNSVFVKLARMTRFLFCFNFISIFDFSAWSPKLVVLGAFPVSCFICNFPFSSPGRLHWLYWVSTSVYSV